MTSIRVYEGGSYGPAPVNGGSSEGPAPTQGGLLCDWPYSRGSGSEFPEFSVLAPIPFLSVSTYSTSSPQDILKVSKK